MSGNVSRISCTHAQILQLDPHKRAHVFVHSVVVFKKWQDFKAGFSSHESIFWQRFVILPCDPSVVTERILFSNKTECYFFCKNINYMLCSSGRIKYFNNNNQIHLFSIMGFDIRVLGRYAFKSWLNNQTPEFTLKPANRSASPGDPTPGHPWSVAGDMLMLPGGIKHQVGLKPSGNKLGGGRRPPRDIPHQVS